MASREDGLCTAKKAMAAVLPFSSFVEFSSFVLHTRSEVPEAASDSYCVPSQIVRAAHDRSEFKVGGTD